MSADPTLQFLDAIEMFNEEEFFECHDALEELWAEAQGDERRFLQGLIQTAVALFHFGNENLGGARKLYDSAMKNLEPFGGIVRGIDVDELRADMRTCFAELLGPHDSYPSHVALRDELVPKIVLHS